MYGRTKNFLPQFLAKLTPDNAVWARHDAGNTEQLW